MELYKEFAYISRATTETWIYVLDGVLYREWENDGPAYLRDSTSHVDAISLDDLDEINNHRLTQIPRAAVEAEIDRQRGIMNAVKMEEEHVI